MAPKNFSVPRVFFPLFALLLIFFVSKASASVNFGCEKIWSGPSTDNDLMSCVLSDEAVKNNWSVFVFPAASALTFVVALVIVPILFFCCACCYKEEKGSVFCKEVFFFIAAISGALLGFTFLIAGGLQFKSSYTAALNEYFDSSTQYPLNVKGNVSLYVNSNSTDLSGFDALEDQLYHNVKETTDKIPSGVVTDVACALAGVLLVLTALTVFIVVMRLRWIACSVLWVFYVLALVLFLLTIAFGAFVYLGDGLCGEIILQYNRQPGIMQWLALPQVKEMANFSSLTDKLQQETDAAVSNGCSVLQSKCTPPTEQISTKPFVCGLSTCNSLSDLITSTEGAYVPVSNAPMFCSPSLIYNYDCSLTFCATNCTEEVQGQAQVVLEAVDAARNASNALSFVSPFQEANFMLDVAMSALESPATSPASLNFHEAIDNCNLLVRSSTILEVGSYVAAFTFFIEAIVLVRVYRRMSVRERPIDHEPMFEQEPEEVFE